MMKGLGDLGQVMKLQSKVKDIQKKLKKMKTEGESSDGSVKAIVDGEFKLVDIKFDEKLFALDKVDRGRLEELVKSAVNSAVDKSRSLSVKEMSKLTGGINIPGISNLFK